MSVSRRGTRLPRRALESLSVKAGVLENATYPADTLVDAKTGRAYPDPRAGMKVATIAAALEYGARQNHPRPFMQQTFAEHRREWAKDLAALLATGHAARESLLTVGQIMKEDIQRTIHDWPADNSERWAQTKGFNKGLVLTNHLHNSIEAEIDTGSGTP